MILGASRYDPELQMFADPPRELDLDHLRFLRWLRENGRPEHRALDGPVGQPATPPRRRARRPQPVR